jgi:hypothetical protein
MAVNLLWKKNIVPLEIKNYIEKIDSSSLDSESLANLVEIKQLFGLPITSES